MFCFFLSKLPMCGARVVMRFVAGNSDLQHTEVLLGRLGLFITLLCNDDVTT
jgi:hypothetical protein